MSIKAKYFVVRPDLICVLYNALEYEKAKAFAIRIKGILLRGTDDKVEMMELK